MNPPWRREKDPVRDTVQALRQAHKCVVAALEWQERGSPGQFDQESLDQARLAYRFLGELMRSRGITTTD